MARPKKENLDYYPKDTSQISNRKIRRLLSKFGAKGYLIYEYILMLIYGGKGYYILVDKNLAFDISDYLNYEISEELVKQVIKSCIEFELFDIEKFEVFATLTNRNIQNNYILARRGATTLRQELIVNDAKKEVFATKTPINEAQTLFNETESTENPEKGAQKKRKENKLKEIKRKGKEKAKEKNTPHLDDNYRNFNSKKTVKKYQAVGEKNNEEKEKDSAEKEKAYFGYSKRYFQDKFGSYIWEISDDFQLSELLKKIEITLARDKLPIEPNQAFEDFLDNLPIFWQQRRFSMQNLNQNFNEILNEIRHKPNGQTGNQNQSERKFGRHTTEELSDFAKNFGK